MQKNTQKSTSKKTLPDATKKSATKKEKIEKGKGGKPANIKKFDLHLGQIIQNFIKDSNKLTYESVSKELKISASGLRNKFLMFHYGNIYDLIEISLICNHDFVKYASLILKEKGIITNKVYSESEYEMLKNERDTLLKDLEHVRKEKERLGNMVDKLMS